MGPYLTVPNKQKDV
jgi:serine/threonine protein phosphatase PrpC